VKKPAFRERQFALERRQEGDRRVRRQWILDLPATRPLHMSPENWTMLTMKDAGYTLQQIADEMGVSRERIRQRIKELIRRTGITDVIDVPHEDDDFYVERVITWRPLP
jgi:DNA-binding NarL/FixJ family response regulator